MSNINCINCFCNNPLTLNFCRKYIRNYGDNDYSLYISKLVNNINRTIKENEICNKNKNTTQYNETKENLYNKLNEAQYFPTYTEYLNWRRSQDSIPTGNITQVNCLL